MPLNKETKPNQTNQEEKITFHTNLISIVI